MANYYGELVTGAALAARRAAGTALDFVGADRDKYRALIADRADLAGSCCMTSY